MNESNRLKDKRLYISKNQALLGSAFLVFTYIGSILVTYYARQILDSKIETTKKHQDFHPGINQSQLTLANCIKIFKIKFKI